MSRRLWVVALIAACSLLLLIGVVRALQPREVRDEQTAQTEAGDLAQGATLSNTFTLTEAAVSSAATTADITADATPGETVRFVQAVASTPETLNPLLTANETTQIVAQLIYPRFVGQDAFTGAPQANALAQAWQADAEARVYTYTLRSDLRWSDGVPVTAADVAFTLNAIRDPATASPFRSLLANVTEVRAAAADTVVITLAQADCATLAAFALPVLPAHRFADGAPMAAALQSGAPTVGAGPFLFQEQQAEGIVLVRNPNAPGAPPVIDEYVLRVMPDADARLAALADGVVDLAVFEGARIGAARQLLNVGVTLAPEDAFDFIALNLADPNAPTSGRDEAGLPLPQPPHPILAEPRVRQALAVAIDYDALLSVAAASSAFRPTGTAAPGATWAASPEIVPVATNPGLAGELLDSVGWRDDDGDGLRMRAGVPLAFSLLVNDDSSVRIQAAQTVADSWRNVGADVSLEILPYEEMSQRVLGQRLDAALLGWNNLGNEPGMNPFWHSRDDRPDTGFNFVSFQDAEVDAWLDETRTVPGCDIDARAALFRRVQERVDSSKPYIVLYGQYQGWAMQNRWQGVAVGPWQPYAAISAWRPAPASP